MSRTAALVLVLMLAGCGSDAGLDAPLTSLGIRDRLAGHTLEATTSGGQRMLVHFERNGRARLVDGGAEFARWYANPTDGLCLVRHGQPPRCAPLYQINVAHFRWGDMRFADLTIRTPDFGRFPDQFRGR